MKKRAFSKNGKLQIINEASEKGVSQALEKYGVYSTPYYSWKKKPEKNEIYGTVTFLQP